MESTVLRPSVRRLLSLALSLACVSVTQAVAGINVRTVDGRTLEARSLRLESGSALAVDTAAGAVRLELEQVVSIEPAGAPPAQSAAANVEVLLRDGSTLIGVLAPASEDAVVLEHAALGPVSIPLDVIRAIGIGAAGARSDTATFPGAEGKDVVLRRGAAAGDYLAGTLLEVGAAGVAVESDLGEVRLPLEQVLGVVVAEVEGAAPREPARKVRVELGPGEHLAGDLLSLTTGEFSIDTSFKRGLAVPLDRVASLRFASGRFEYLSDLEPAEVQETPFIGGPDDFLFGWQRDRSVTGQPLLVKGRRFAKGLGLHSRCRLAYDLGGRYARLEGAVGVSDEVLALAVRGSLVFRFLVDGTLRFESPELEGGREAVALPALDLAGAEQLVVEVDFGQRGDVADRAVLGDPILVRSSP